MNDQCVGTYVINQYYAAPNAVTSWCYVQKVRVRCQKDAKADGLCIGCAAEKAAEQSAISE